MKMKAVEIQEDDTKKLYEASIRGCVTTLNILLQRDELILDRTSLTLFKETPLHISCLLGHLDFTKAILGRNPGLASVLDSRGQSPLHSAASRGHTEIVKALLIANSDACLIPNQHGLIPLHLAAMRGRIEVVQELVRARPASVHVKLQGSKETVLHLCVNYNQIDALKLLVTSMLGDRESLNSADSEGNTIWQLALMMKQFETISFLASIPEVRVETNAFLEIQDLEPTSITRPTRQKHENTGPAERALLPNGGQAAAEPVGHKVTSYFERRRKSIKSRRGELMIVTTVIATMAFQAGINPPGGVWQADQPDCNGVVGTLMLTGTTCKAGTSVLAFTDSHIHHRFIISNTVSYGLSLAIIFLLIGLPLRNWFTMGLLLITMCGIIVCMAATYLYGVVLVGAKDDAIEDIAIVYGMSWAGMLVVYAVIQAIRFQIWVVKKSYVGLRNCLASRKARAYVPPENRV